VLWALSDKSGLPAKLFAEMDPVPPLSWLDELSKNRYNAHDLARFGVFSSASTDENFHFSLLDHPAAPAHVPNMKLIHGGSENVRWDDRMRHLAAWMARHLNDPDLLLWFAKNGGNLHTDMIGVIEAKLNDLADLECKRDTDALENIRSNAPNAVPDQKMRAFWNIALAGGLKSQSCDFDLYDWIKQLERDGFTVTLHLKLRDLLTPKIELAKDFFNDQPGVTSIDWTLVFVTDDTRSLIHEHACTHLRKLLPELKDDFQLLLRNALDISRMLDGSDNNYDNQSYVYLPSVSPHEQNKKHCEWVVLIELLRDAWLGIREKNNLHAARIAKEWFSFPYLTFKRLALFAASQDDCISARLWLKWLLADNAQCLWSVNTRRETMRLLVLQSKFLHQVDATRLEKAIMKGSFKKHLRMTGNGDVVQRGTTTIPFGCAFPNCE
jgi:hypothetical protein